jgi:hypothetical protein
LIKNIICFTLSVFCIGIANITFAGYDSWLNKTIAPPWLDEKAVLVPTQLVIPVAQSELKKAINMLKNKQIEKLNLQTAAKLLELDAISPDQILIKVFSEASEKAKQKMEEAKDPFFVGDTAKRMQKQADDFNRNAAKAKALHRKLKAYLVRALVLNEATGEFTVYYKGYELWIYHHSLGKDVAPMKRRPLIVFLESQPTKIYIDADTAH